MGSGFAAAQAVLRGSSIVQTLSPGNFLKSALLRETSRLKDRGAARLGSQAKLRIILAANEALSAQIPRFSTKTPRLRAP
jgi:hypothetical protein